MSRTNNIQQSRQAVNKAISYLSNQHGAAVTEAKMLMLKAIHKLDEVANDKPAPRHPLEAKQPFAQQANQPMAKIGNMRGFREVVAMIDGMIAQEKQLLADLDKAQQEAAGDVLTD